MGTAPRGQSHVEGVRGGLWGSLPCIRVPEPPLPPLAAALPGERLRVRAVQGGRRAFPLRQPHLGVHRLLRRLPQVRRVPVPRRVPLGCRGGGGGSGQLRGPPRRSLTRPFPAGTATTTTPPRAPSVPGSACGSSPSSRTRWPRQSPRKGPAPGVGSASSQPAAPALCQRSRRNGLCQEGRGCRDGAEAALDFSPSPHAPKGPGRGRGGRAGSWGVLPALGGLPAATVHGPAWVNTTCLDAAGLGETPLGFVPPAPWDTR